MRIFGSYGLDLSAATVGTGNRHTGEGRIVMRLRGGSAPSAAVLGMVLVLTGCDDLQDLSADDAASGSAQDAGPGRAVSPLANPDGTEPGLAAITSDTDRAEARALIEKVATKGRGPKTGYDRDEFGYAWMDSAPGGIPYARNGCDTRIISMVRRVMQTFTQLTQGVVSCAC